VTSMLPVIAPEPHILEKTLPLTSAERMLFASCKPATSAAHGPGSVNALVDMVFEHYAGEPAAE
jgi:hypothetical protein